jgi:hypothetical protein
MCGISISLFHQDDEERQTHVVHEAIYYCNERRTTRCPGCVSRKENPTGHLSDCKYRLNDGFPCWPLAWWTLKKPKELDLECEVCLTEMGLSDRPVFLQHEDHGIPQAEQDCNHVLANQGGALIKTCAGGSKEELPRCMDDDTPCRSFICGYLVEKLREMNPGEQHFLTSGNCIFLNMMQEDCTWHHLWKPQEDEVNMLKQAFDELAEKRNLNALKSTTVENSPPQPTSEVGHTPSSLRHSITFEPAASSAHGPRSWWRRTRASWATIRGKLNRTVTYMYRRFLRCNRRNGYQRLDGQSTISQQPSRKMAPQKMPKTK